MYAVLYIYTFQIAFIHVICFYFVLYVFVFPSYVNKLCIIYILLNKLGNNARDLLLRVFISILKNRFILNDDTDWNETLSQT